MAQVLLFREAMTFSFLERPAVLLLLASLGACSGGTSAHLPGDSTPDASVAHPASGEDAGDPDPNPGTGAGGGAAACSGNSISFTALLPPGGPSCLGDPSTCYSWLSLTGPDGAPVAIDPGCGIVCGPGVCGVQDCMCGPSPSTSTNPARTWDGTVYVDGHESSSCPAGGFRCSQPACAAPGTYTATMCAYPAAPTNANGVAVCSTADDAGVVCDQVTFHWPPSSSGVTVTGLIPYPVGTPVGK